MQKKFETYGDMLARFYPNENKEMRIAGGHCQDITLQVTEACNMRCTYCYQHNKTGAMMDFETGKKFVDMVLDADERVSGYINSKESLGCVLSFIGGEPLLAIDLIDKLTDYFIHRLFTEKHLWATRYRINICSNGLLYFDTKVQKYIAKHYNHLDFSVSIDGCEELHDSCRVDAQGKGTYTRALAAAQHYHDHFGGYVGTKVTLSPTNVQYTFAAVKNLLDLGFREININCVYESGWNNEHASVLYTELKKVSDWIVEHELTDEAYISILDWEAGHPLPSSETQNYCGGTGLMVAVNPSGEIYPCLRYMETSVGKNRAPYIIGTVDAGIMCDAEQCSRVDCFRKITRRSQSTDECFDCPIAAGCGWCSAYNYEVFGTADKRTTFICPMHKARCLAIAYHKNTIFRAMGSPERSTLYVPKEWALDIIDPGEYERLKTLSEVT